MKRRRRTGLRFLLAAVVLAVVTGGCSARKATPGSTIPSKAGTAPDQAAGQQASNLGPTVTVSYAHTDDYLRRMSVTKYESAQVIATRKKDAKDTAAIVRFEGGVVIWRIESGGGIFSHAKFRVGKVDYGKVPDAFNQVIPESGEM